MSTWLSSARLAMYGDRPALRSADGSVSVSYAELASAVGDAARAMQGPRTLAACRLALDVSSIVGYLGAREAGHVTLLLEPDGDADREERMRTTYRPGLWISSGASGVNDQQPSVFTGDGAGLEADPSLGVLLTTSGSTGSPKLVRLADAAVAANAGDIAHALGITPDDVAITTLPLHYSYGLSVLHSHLLAGATVVLNTSAVVTREFWEAVARYRATSLAGVPYTYEMLRRIRFDPAQHPSIRVLTQAGGRLAPERIAEVHAKTSAAGVRFHVMYGQTEATARIAILDAERLPAKLGSVGTALRSGRLSINGADDAGVGDVVYEGPNVMLGYATTREDLARGDDLRGRLETGDLGRLDADAHLFITGRRARLAKVFGTRVDLDDVERRLLPPGVVSVDAGDRLGLAGELPAESLDALRTTVANAIGVHPTGVVVRSVAALPRLASGKVDYASVREAF